MLLNLTLNTLLILFAFFQKECNNTKESSIVSVKQGHVKWEPVQVKESPDSISIDAFYIKDILPRGYTKDASKDYTAYIQLAISKYREVVFPPFPLLINDNGLKIRSNKRIIFLKGAELRLKPSSNSHYAMLYIYNASNVELINPVIWGDRNEHIGTSGEWGMGIRISSSTNVSIYNPKVYNCWGDGIYINGNIKQKTSSDINIVNAYCRDNRRNGISIISVDGLILESPYAGYNNGTNPKSGIDIEPNHPSDIIKNIKILHPRTEYNPGKGITIGLNKLYGEQDKQISIDILNPQDYASSDGFLISCTRQKSVRGEKIIGHINVTNPIWKMNSNAAISVYKLREPAIRLMISNPLITDISGNNLTKETIRENINQHIGENVIYQLK